MAPEERRHVYLFAMDPDTLLRLAVVYRLKFMDPTGYQRDLRSGKLRSINEYLSDWANYFPNSILVAFDEEGAQRIRWIKDGSANDGPVESGRIEIPKYHGIAEIIDGQHRLYGYVDFTEDHEFDKLLAQRRKDDRLLVVAVPDPDGSERPGLYLSINSTQTKISTREIWALMGETRPTTKMGFISNLIRRLNAHGVFRDEIEIPRVTRGRRAINVANFGKGLADRHLLDNSGEEFGWNLWRRPRVGGPYPEVADERIAGQLDLYFRCVRDSCSDDWRDRGSFLRSNNGVNVMLRVLVEVLRYYPGKQLTSERVMRLLKPAVRTYIREYGAEKLLGDTSNETGRERVAREIMERINLKYRGFAHEHLEARKARKRK